MTTTSASAATLQLLASTFAYSVWPQCGMKKTVLPLTARRPHSFVAMVVNPKRAAIASSVCPCVWVRMDVCESAVHGAERANPSTTHSGSNGVASV